MKVLIVEDNDSTRLLLEEIVRVRGHEVSSCADAESALRLYNEQDYPLVLLDWLLPGMDGLELCRRMRRLPRGERSLIFVITARDQGEDLRAVLEAGADDYVAKPIDVEVLDVRFAVAERRVENLLKRKQAEAELARTMADLARSRDDMLSILNQLQVGTAMTDARGKLTFLSRAARAVLPDPGGDLVGRRWEDALPLLEVDRDALRDMCAREASGRSKVSALVELTDAERRWVDIEVHDDPRDPLGKIFVFYDVSDLHNLRFLLDEKAHFQDLVGKSEAMLKMYEQIRRIASVDTTVLIEGETGTGKELVARAIHFGSHRKDKPFVAVNCAGLTDSILASQLFGHRRGAFTGAVEDHKGFFEAAHTGTLFLDELGDISPSVQTSLLRVLQEREFVRLGETRPRKVDVRVIAASHHNLNEDAARGKFRSDLLYRIRVARIPIPPLRERREDIPLLLSCFLDQCRATIQKPIQGLNNDAMRKLVAYHWPGNVRELRSALEYAAISCTGTILGVEDLPPEVREQAAGEAPKPPPIPDDEGERIRRAIQDTKGNRSAAAQKLGVSRATFYRRLAELGLNKSRS